MNFVASNLKFLRKQTGLSQEQFATELNLNRGNIASYEKGTAEPSIEKLIKFAEFFGTNVTTFIQEDLTKHSLIETMKNKNENKGDDRTFSATDRSIEPDVLNNHQLRKDISYIAQNVERIASALEALVKLNKEALRLRDLV